MSMHPPFNPFDSQAFREEFESTLDRKLAPITKEQTAQGIILARHEKDIERAKSMGRLLAKVAGYVIAILGTLGGAITAHLKRFF